MEVNEFNNDQFSYLKENLFGEKSKNIILMGDFNVDSLKYKNDSNIAHFLDLVYSSSLIPQITTPTHLSPRSKTLIDKIFTNDNTEDNISGNVLSNFQTTRLSERFIKY